MFMANDTPAHCIANWRNLVPRNFSQDGNHEEYAIIAILANVKCYLYIPRSRAELYIILNRPGVGLERAAIGRIWLS